MIRPTTVPPGLREVIRRMEERSRRERQGRGAVSLADSVGGSEEATDRGSLLVVRRRFPLTHAHGVQPLASAWEVAWESLALLSPANASPCDTRRLLYLDTETTGLAGGTGTYAFLVGVGFFDGDEFEVRQFFMRDLDEEPALIGALERLFQQFDGLVTYNGRGFDLPLLETRFVLARRPWPDAIVHLDLLHPARRLWGWRLPDCRLGTVEQEVLGFIRENDLPGALIPSVYFDYLRRKMPGELPRVFDHNRHDILSLVALCGWVGNALTRAPALELDPRDLAGLGRLWESSDPERGVACYRMALERGLPSPGRERLLMRLAWYLKRRARWEEARALWEAAIRSNSAFDPRPWEEMAKIYEHRWRDFPVAHSLVEQALHRAQAGRAPESVLGALAHRLDRLSRRMQRVS